MMKPGYVSHVWSGQVDIGQVGVGQVGLGQVDVGQVNDEAGLCKPRLDLVRLLQVRLMMKLCLHKPGLGQVRLMWVRLVMKLAYVSIGQVNDEAGLCKLMNL